MALRLSIAEFQNLNASFLQHSETISLSLLGGVEDFLTDLGGSVCTTFC